MASLVKQGSSFYLAFYDRRKKPRQKKVSLGRVTKKAAARLQSRLQDDYALGKYDPWATAESDHTVIEAINLFLLSRSNKSNSTYRNYAWVLHQFSTYAGQNRHICTVTEADISGFLESREVRLASKHNYSRHIKAFWRWALRGGIVSRDIFSVQQLETLPVKFPKHFTVEQLESLYRAIESEALENPMVTRGDPRWIIPVIQFAVETGLRRGEIVSLNWESVDPAGAFIDVFATKSKRDRRIPLTPRAREILDNIPQYNGVIFRTSSGSEIYPPYLSRAFRRYCIKAGLAHTSFHTLRHTACSRLASRGVPAEAIRRFAGHSSISVTGKYMHLSDDGYASWFEGDFTPQS